jgi:hypothetical protein
MILIVAHHFVVNSGLCAVDGPMTANPDGANTLFLYLFGMWGKTGINCFLMITGYFMCTSRITVKKFLKLLLWIYIYKFLFFGIFFYAGYEPLRMSRLIKLIMPVWGFNSNFTSCFLAFWLTIPFWNILIKNMSRRQHLLLTGLLLLYYTVLGSVPGFDVSFNYITWFGVIYLTASYIRLYPMPIFSDGRLWRRVSLAVILLAMASVYVCHKFLGWGEYMFVSDSNRILAVAVAVATFLWFKNINLAYSKIINTLGATTFGVLLIHANSDAMRQWLWQDTVDCVGHYELPLPELALYSVMSVLAIFFICSAIDRVRQIAFEEPFFRWYDRRMTDSVLLSKLKAFRSN